MITRGDRIKITERGWAGHFICSHHCLFRRNTLIEYGDKKWVVSTVGNMRDPLTKQPTTIGYDRWYETMAFEARESNGYIEADVEKEIFFNSDCGIYAKTFDELKENYPCVDNMANDMHDKVVIELCGKIKE